MKLRNIHYEMHIDVTPQTMWLILTQYGDVASFHGGVAKSYKEQGSDNKAELGGERICNIVDLGLHITLKERITHYVEGESYQYEVYEWKNFPIQKMSFGFKILDTTLSHTTLALDIDYKAKPAILTPLLAGKMRRLARDILLGYKHYAETGEARVPIKNLKNRYQDSKYAEVSHG